MIVHVTPCCREKEDSPGLMPAIDRYRSPRIRAVCDTARVADSPFRILSGRFGLLAPEERIPYYDQRLLPADVPAMAKRVAGQLLALGVTEVVFVSPGPEADPGVMPYREAIEIACRLAALTLRLQMPESHRG